MHNIDDLDNRPEALNLINIYASFSNESVKEILQQFSGKGFSQFKESLSDLIINEISPIAKEMNHLMNNKDEIIKLENEKIIPLNYIDLRRGAGAYICGEESAMIESIEGKRGLPRHRPPYVGQSGIFGKPTLVHNIETLYWVAKIMREGPEIFTDFNKNNCMGLRSYSVSGRVKKPGLYLLPSGSTILDIIEASGGMIEGHQFKAYQPGGASSGLLPATINDVPLDFGTLDKYNTFIGSAAVVVLSDKDKIRDVALNLIEFFKSESCGQCTPCRVGCEKAVTLSLIHI